CRSHLVIGYVHGNIEDRLFAATQPFWPTQGDVEGFLSLNHLREGGPANSDLDGGLDVGHAHVPACALLAVNGKLQVRLALDAKDADVFYAWDLRFAVSILLFERCFHLPSQVFQFVQVWTDDLDGVVALDSRQALHDVVSDV